MGGKKKSDENRAGDELTKRVKRLEIDDEDTGTETRVKTAFSQHFQCTCTASTSSGGGGKQGQIIFSALNSNEDRVIGGTTTGFIRAFDPCHLNLDGEDRSTATVKHTGLSSVRCSKVTPEVFYSSSSADGQILLWDTRQAGRKAAQIFTIAPDTRIGGSTRGSGSASTSSPKLKPLLTFDISANDQVLCGGTELIGGEDSYLLFWDTRSSKLLGAYWESHSDDVTAIKFHPSVVNSLASGSTDGLINIFNLEEPNEDDALIYSLNTESSVESLEWNIFTDNDSIGSGTGKSFPESFISCVTHTNDVQIWDAISGDKFVHFGRENIADAMMRSNVDAVYVNGCYKAPSSKSQFGILTCSLKGSCTRYISIVGDALEPSSLFVDQTAILQTAQYLPKANKWITFDEDGLLREWSNLNLQDTNAMNSMDLALDTNLQELADDCTEDRKAKRDKKLKLTKHKKPYSRPE